MSAWRFLCGALSVLLFVALTGCEARPLVRHVKNDREFQRLIKHHKEVTGLPVIVDFFSNGCGPCRMIAPHFKQLAKQYKGKAVFAKVDVNFNRETSAKQQIRSMPTFQAYLLGKKRQQFSGADINSLRSITQQLSYEAQKYDVELTLDSLKNFYSNIDAFKDDESKVAAQAEKILEKAGNGGPSHYKMCQRLKKKYGNLPETVKRSENSAKKKDKGPSGTGKSAGQAGRARRTASGPNLHLASMEDLLAEVERRREIEEEKKADAEEEGDDGDEESTMGNLTAYVSDNSGIPERIVIIGAGPAGLAAGVYAARAGLSPVIVAPSEGGQLQGKGVLVENFPGVTGITGPVIVQDMRQQASSFGARFLEEKVVRIDAGESPFKIYTEGSNLTSHSVVIATGADSRWLGVEGEYDFRGGGVSSCATCDGFLFREKPVVVVGGGDTAMEDALVLARTSSSVTIIHRRDTFRASHVLSSRVFQHPSIHVKWNSTVERFSGTNSSDSGPILTHVHIRNSADGSTEEFEASGAFVAIGHDPNTNMLEGQVDIDTDGYIKTLSGSSKTSIAGLFAAGDVADKVYRQAITSAGSGAMAALDAERWLSENGIQDERKKLEDDLMAEILAEYGV